MVRDSCEYIHALFRLMLIRTNIVIMNDSLKFVSYSNLLHSKHVVRRCYYIHRRRNVRIKDIEETSTISICNLLSFIIKTFNANRPLMKLL